MLMFTFPVLERKYLLWAYLAQKKYAQYEICFGPEILFFGHIWSTKSKLPVQDKIGFPDQFKYAEFDGNAHFFCFGPETPFLGIPDPKISELYQIKSGT